LGYLTEEQLSMLLLPIGAMQKSEVRSHAERLGLRTWDKPDSQDVCFIEASKGREVFLRQRVPLTNATIFDRATGEVVGETNAAELMTVGQRRGVLPDRNGQKRYIASVNVPERRIEVGTLDEVLIKRIALDESSLSFTHDKVQDGEEVLAQWSAHGRVQVATFRNDGSCALELAAPARPVAPGQSVVMYKIQEPTIVAGAAIVLRS
jgi:tRNA-specific 2-thiouridylase